MGQLYCMIDEKRRVNSGGGHWSYNLLGPENGCMNSCETGISYYSSIHFTPGARHDFQEGFLVLSGAGEAQVEGQIFSVTPMMSFLVPAGMEHSLRSTSPDEPLVLFWFHASA